MLQKLRNLSSDSKKKIASVAAGGLTLVVFVFWVFHFSGLFGDTLRSVKDNSSIVFGKMEKKIGELYNGFDVNMKNIFGTTTATTSFSTTNQASSTEVKIFTTTEEVMYDSMNTEINNKE